MLIGPLAWVAYLQTASMLVPGACRRPTGAMLALLAAGVLALALSTAGLLRAWQAWQRVGPAAQATGMITARTRVVALAGIAGCALLALVIVGGLFPVLLLAPCG